MSLSVLMRKKQPNILLDRIPANRYVDDGANDKDIRISSVLRPYVQMRWPKFDLSRLCTAIRMEIQIAELSSQFNLV